MSYVDQSGRLLKAEQQDGLITGTLKYLKQMICLCPPVEERPEWIDKCEKSRHVDMRLDVDEETFEVCLHALAANLVYHGLRPIRLCHGIFALDDEKLRVVFCEVAPRAPYDWEVEKAA